MRRALFLAIALVCLATSSATAQDPAQVDAKHNKVEFANDKVRVLRFHLGPKESTPTYEEPTRVVIPLTGGHLKFTLADGKTEEGTRKAGSAVYRTAVRHAIDNLSDKDYESIVVELKSTSAASKPAAQKSKKQK
jgi:hypothetical protein